MSFTSTVQDSKAFKLLAILWDGGRRSPLWFSSQQWGVWCTSVGNGELKTVWTETLILGTRMSFASCLSKGISSPNYMKKFPELSTKQSPLTPTVEEVRRVLTPKPHSDRQSPIKAQQCTERTRLQRKGLFALPEELARSHNASWKERGSCFSLGFQAHVVTARGRHARNFIP